MYYFYVIKGRKNNQLYFGYTNNLKERIAQHNSGKVESTKPLIPLKLVYHEAYTSMNDAKHREYSIKLRGNAYLQMKRRINNCVTETEWV